MICCSGICANLDCRSPFRQIICFDYYDGVLSGLAQCAVCAKAYAFRVVAWETTRKVRAYGFIEISHIDYMRAFNVLAENSNPTEPLWAPQLQFEDKAKENSVNAMIDSVLADLQRPQFLVASEDLSVGVRAAREVTQGHWEAINSIQGLQEPNPEELDKWLSFLMQPWQD